MKIIWWLIQLLAVLCCVLFYLVVKSDVDTHTKYLAFAVVIVAALLEYFAYYRLYKPIR